MKIMLKLIEFRQDYRPFGVKMLVRLTWRGIQVQLIFAVQDGLRKGNGIPAANQDVQIEIHFPGREDHQNSEKCCDETF